jgi:hypothetical protein
MNTMQVKALTRARVVFYTHFIVAVVCAGLATYALYRRAERDWQFDKSLNVFFSNPILAWAYPIFILSSFAFPIAVADETVGRISAWRWCPMIIIEFGFAAVQYVALILLLPGFY